MFIEKLEKYGQRELTRALQLGDYVYGIIQHNETVDFNKPCDVLFLGTQKNHNNYIYSFDDHGLVNAYLNNKPILTRHSEFDLVSEFQSTKIMTRDYLTFMANTFGDNYTISEFNHRTNKTLGLQETYNKNIQTYRCIYMNTKILNEELKSYGEEYIAPGELIEKSHKMKTLCSIVKAYLQYLKDGMAYEKEMCNHIKALASDKAKAEIDKLEKQAREKKFNLERPEINIDNAHEFTGNRRPNDTNSHQPSDFNSFLKNLGIDLDKIIEDTAASLGIEKSEIDPSNFNVASAKVTFDKDGNPIFESVSPDQMIKDLQGRLFDSNGNPNFQVLSQNDMEKLINNGFSFGNLSNQNQSDANEDEGESQQ